MTTTIRPTRQALRLHQSHLATTHRAPLVKRGEVTRTDAPGAPAAAEGAVRTRTRATAFTPLRRDPLSVERHLTFQPAVQHGHPDEA